MNPITKNILRKALKQLEQGNPCEAVDWLNVALQDDATFDQHKLIEKAHEQASVGTPAEAERLLVLALDKPDQGRVLRWTPAAVMGRLGGLKRSIAKTEAARRNARQPRPNRRKVDKTKAGTKLTASVS